MSSKSRAYSSIKVIHVLSLYCLYHNRNNAHLQVVDFAIYAMNKTKKQNKQKQKRELS